jgi:glutathione S-transferase
MKLVVGTDSTWSLRAWICGQLVGIELEIIVIDLAAPDYKKQILNYSPTGLVPALITENCVIHDSLAIAEYFNELSNQRLYPDLASERAIARSLCAEMHSGFISLRGKCPFNLSDNLSPVSLDRNLSSELERVKSIFECANGRFMFEKPSIVDAFYAILAYRMASYGILLDGKAGEYQSSLLTWSHLKNALALAKQW